MKEAEGISLLKQCGVDNLRAFRDVTAALDYAEQLYRDGVQSIRDAVCALDRGEDPPGGNGRYVVLGLPVERFSPQKLRDFHRMPFGWCRQGEGVYASELTQPELFRPYLLEQLPPLLDRYDTVLLVGTSPQEIPLHFALEGSGIRHEVAEDTLWQRFRWPDLNAVCWESRFTDNPRVHRLLHYEAASTDLQLARLRHYTHTDPKSFQQYLFLTNYPRYLKYFMDWAQQQAADPDSGCMRVEMSAALHGHVEYWNLPQMPAVHAIWPGNTGLSIVNIGVSASNAWNLIDNVAPLRPLASILLGHCGGLRETQHRGMLVLGQGFINDARIAGENGHDLHAMAPIGEIDHTVSLAACEELGIDPDDVDRKRNTIERAIVVTTGNRGWEYRSDLVRQYLDAKAGVIEMEAAAALTAANKHGIPLSFVGRISDVPVTGDLKMPGMAGAFYETATESHLAIGIRAWRKLRDNPAAFQSRMLRSASSPPLR